MVTRRKSKAINIGNVTVGGGAPIVVQSMTKTNTADVKATVRQIKELEEYGCEIIRVAVPDIEAAEAIKEIKRGISIPLIADIHFDFRLALKALESGADGLRLNPGNIGGPERVEAVARAAKERGIPIRVGVNAGSLPKDTNPNLTISEQMVAAALKHIEMLERFDFDFIKVSVKAFDVPTTIETYQFLAGSINYPLHLGITESGTPKQGIVRSAVGIGTLLYQGIGDTIRVSLTAQPREEVMAAYEILKSLNLRQRGPVLVSCPTCGRTEADVIKIAETIADELARIDKPIRVAVMGCAVNGPGEAKDADIGIACGRGRGILFRHGEKMGVVEEKDYVAVLKREIAAFPSS